MSGLSFPIPNQKSYNRIIVADGKMIGGPIESGMFYFLKDRHTPGVVRPAVLERYYDITGLAWDLLRQPEPEDIDEIQRYLAYLR